MHIPPAVTAPQTELMATHKLLVFLASEGEYVLVLCSVHVALLPDSVHHLVGQFSGDFATVMAGTV